MLVTNKNVVAVMGFVRSGRTQIAKHLAERLNMRFLDVDELMEQSSGIARHEIITRLGETGFLEAEARALREATNMSSVVISADGRSLHNLAIREILEKSCTTVFLTGDLETVFEHACQEATTPDLGGFDADVKQNFF